MVRRILILSLAAFALSGCGEKGKTEQLHSNLEQTRTDLSGIDKGFDCMEAGAGSLRWDQLGCDEYLASP